MYTRSLTIENNTFFLFGPRGVGKSTWLKSQLPNAHYIDLLKTDVFIKLNSDPSLLRAEVLALASNSWIIIDEIQKIPTLLDEVHFLLEEFKNKYKFILTGSSARKLKRGGANLLGGRAMTRQMYTLNMVELADDFDIDQVLAYGTLPLVISDSKTDDKILRLHSYVETYLREEIQQEAAVKNLTAYSRFLKVCAMMNGQKLNMSAIARDTRVERSTVQGYFQILKDTMIGDFLQPWPLKFRVKEVDHPKFYLFDTGVIRTLQNTVYDKIEKAEKGFLVETFIFNELKAFNSYKKIGFELYYWGVSNGAEVDFIISRGKKAIGLEVKSTHVWKTEYNKTLDLLITAKKLNKAYGIYLGNQILKFNDITVYPLQIFLDKLYSEESFLF